ncbi:MAG TPA: TetR/AcrR family transcriptional regulator [Desulfobacteraceae bacterium]|nr:TetR/AcrR family transcriptional regulator [Desulfobacteraceae bacterium]
MQKANKKSDKKTAIIEAALDLIAENGFQGAPTSKIADKAGVGVGSIYRYFKDKETLIHEIFNDLAEKINIEILKDFKPESPFREQYLRISTNAFNYLVENPKVLAFTEQYFNSPFGVQHRLSQMLGNNGIIRHENPLLIIFESAIKERIIKEFPQPVITALTFGPIVFAVRDILNGLIEYTDEMVAKIVEACWDAIKI